MTLNTFKTVLLLLLLLLLFCLFACVFVFCCCFVGVSVVVVVLSFVVVVTFFFFFFLFFFPPYPEKLRRNNRPEHFFFWRTVAGNETCRSQVVQRYTEVISPTQSSPVAPVGTSDSRPVLAERVILFYFKNRRVVLRPLLISFVC